MKKYVAVLLVTVLVFILLVVTHDSSVPIIKDVYVINLDGSKDRWANVQREFSKLGSLPVIRWSAIDGRKMTRDEMRAEKIPHTMFPETVKDPKLRERRRGEIGCYLSHRKLLEYLATLDCSPDEGHLILEDDVTIHPDILSRWKTAATHLDPDWGLFYFGLSGNIKQGESRHGISPLLSGWGAYGYVVRHSNLSQLLSKAATMTEPIDDIYQRHYEQLGAYVLTPHLILPNGDTRSTIWDGIKT
jgi:GR25 family glycosyltransferase involved in LPS biosynthesis